MKRVQEILHLQSTLDNMGLDNVRADFKAGQNGAVQLTEDNLNQLDQFYKLVSPTRESEERYSMHLFYPLGSNCSVNTKKSWTSLSRFKNVPQMPSVKFNQASNKAKMSDRSHNVGIFSSTVVNFFSSFEEALSAASEHIVNYVESKDKEVAGTTYKDLKDVVQKIENSHYFDLKSQRDAAKVSDGNVFEMFFRVLKSSVSRDPSLSTFLSPPVHLAWWADLCVRTSIYVTLISGMRVTLISYLGIVGQSRVLPKLFVVICLVLRLGSKIKVSG